MTTSDAAAGRRRSWAENFLRQDTGGIPAYAVDFTAPEGEPALAPPDSVSWQVFKNPVSLFIGGVTAVLLELAEPHVRSGVWDHTTFRTDPLARLRRTGLAAMLTVYGPKSKAEQMIRGVNRMHARVKGTTPSGSAYEASDPVLLDWVQATASYGFLEAYSAFARPLTGADKDRFYAESKPAAALYGALGAPASLSEQRAQFAAMAPNLERSDIVFEFLAIMQKTKIMPRPLRFLQRIFVRAGVEVTPPWLRETLGLGPGWGLKSWEKRLVRFLGAASDRMVIRGAPASQSCVRMGLPADYLYRSRRDRQRSQPGTRPRHGR